MVKLNRLQLDTSTGYIDHFKICKRGKLKLSIFL